MSDPTEAARRLEIAGEAMGWLMELTESEMSQSQSREFAEWLLRSPSHVEELLHAVSLQNSWSKSKVWFDIGTDIRRSDSNVAFLPQYSPRTQAHGRRMHRGIRRRLMIGSAVVALLAIATIAVVDYINAPVRFTTSQKERLAVTLPDRSTVNLAPNSVVRVRMTSQARLVWLEQGEALFSVSKDPDRPFVVQALGTSVRAVGTEFDVSRSTREVHVAVVEGRVSVSPQASADAVFLNANQQLYVPSDGDGPSVPQTVVPAEAVEWTTGLMVLKDDSVADVVRRFNRHNSALIRILNPSISERRISGTFLISDPQSFVDFLQLALGEHSAPVAAIETN